MRRNCRRRACNIAKRKIQKFSPAITPHFNRIPQLSEHGKNRTVYGKQQRFIALRPVPPDVIPEDVSIFILQRRRNYCDCRRRPGHQRNALYFKVVCTRSHSHPLSVLVIDCGQYKFTPSALMYSIYVVYHVLFGLLLVPPTTVPECNIPLLDCSKRRYGAMTSIVGFAWMASFGPPICVSQPITRPGMKSNISAPPLAEVSAIFRVGKYPLS